MSNLVLDGTHCGIEKITIVSKAPFDEAVSENSLISHTYNLGTQMYEFEMTIVTTSNDQDAAFRALVEQVGGSDSFKIDFGSFSDGLLPKKTLAREALTVRETALAGSSSIDLSAADVLAVGDFIQLDGTTDDSFDDDKIYRITNVEVNAARTVVAYNIFPLLRHTTTTTATVKVGLNVMPRVRIKSDMIKSVSEGEVPNLRRYTLKTREARF